MSSSAQLLHRAQARTRETEEEDEKVKAIDVLAIDAKLASIGVPQFIDFQTLYSDSEDRDRWFHEASTIDRDNSQAVDDSLDKNMGGRELDEDEDDEGDDDDDEDASAREPEPDDTEPAAELDARDSSAGDPVPIDVALVPAMPAAYTEDDASGERTPDAREARELELEPSSPAHAAAAPLGERRDTEPMPFVSPSAQQPTAPPPALALGGRDAGTADISPSPNTSSPANGGRFAASLSLTCGLSSPRTPEPLRAATPTVARPEPKSAELAQLFAPSSPSALSRLAAAPSAFPASLRSPARPDTTGPDASPLTGRTSPRTGEHAQPTPVSASLLRQPRVFGAPEPTAAVGGAAEQAAAATASGAAEQAAAAAAAVGVGAAEVAFVALSPVAKSPASSQRGSKSGSHGRPDSASGLRQPQPIRRMAAGTPQHAAPQPAAAGSASDAQASAEAAGGQAAAVAVAVAVVLTAAVAQQRDPAQARALASEPPLGTAAAAAAAPAAGQGAAASGGAIAGAGSGAGSAALSRLWRATAATEAKRSKPQPEEAAVLASLEHAAPPGSAAAAAGEPSALPRLLASTLPRPASAAADGGGGGSGGALSRLWKPTAATEAKKAKAAEATELSAAASLDAAHARPLQPSSAHDGGQASAQHEKGILARLWKATAATQAKRVPAHGAADGSAEQPTVASVTAALAAAATPAASGGRAGASASALAHAHVSAYAQAKARTAGESGKEAAKPVEAAVVAASGAARPSTAGARRSHIFGSHAAAAAKPHGASAAARPASAGALASSDARGAHAAAHSHGHAHTAAATAAELPLSTDELRLLQAEAEVAESKQRQRTRAARLRSVLMDVGKHLPTHSTRGLTMPREFVFKSDERARAHAQQVSGLESGRAGGGAGAGSECGGLVSPRPILPLAEAIAHFEFRSSHGEAPRADALGAEDSTLSAGGSKGPTHPRPFHLLTDLRARPTTILSTEERTLLDMAQAQATSHARPVNPKVMHSHGHMGVPRVQKAAPTTFAQFHLATAERAAAAAAGQRSARLSSSSSVSAESDAHFKPFRARPVPKATYTPEKPLAHSSHFVPTEARAPVFATHIRARNASSASEPSSPAVSFRARPMPLAPTPDMKPQHKQPTEPVPFALQTEVRGELAARHLAERVRGEAEEEARLREFHARGVPQSEPFAPVLGNSVLCEPRPFELRTDIRHALSQAQLEALVAEQENEMRAHSQFKARECTVTKAQPFVVHKSTKPLTELQDVTLHTVERHNERAVFESELKTRRHDAELVERATAAKAAERERAEIAEMRKGMEFKARPVPAAVFLGQPVSVSHAIVKRAATIAMSPKFHTSMRMLARRSAPVHGPA